MKNIDIRKKIILHLCCKSGSDTHYFDLDPEFEVFKVTEEIGVENFNIPDDWNVVGVFSNPPCLEFSTADYSRVCDIEAGMFCVRHCQRIIQQAKDLGNLKWWVIENPSRGTLWKHLGIKPTHKFQPWQYGSGYSKDTGLYGEFVMPDKLYTKWEDAPKNENLYVRKGRRAPSLVLLHKSALQYLPEFEWAREFITCDADLRSMASDTFARLFYEANK